MHTVIGIRDGRSVSTSSMCYLDTQCSGSFRYS